MFSKLINLFGSSSKNDMCNEEDIPSINIETSIVTSSSTSNSNNARKLLKEATQLKKCKEYDAACEKLREAYAAPDADELMVKERLRLPMYLQLAGKSDEGWRVINEMNVEYIDLFSQAEIANQMRVFLQKDKQFKKAILFSIWTIARGIQRDIQNVGMSTEHADQMAEYYSEYKFLEQDNEKEIYGYTPKGNPITDCSYELMLSNIAEAKSIEGITQRIESDMKKAKLSHMTRELAEDISAYFTQSTDYCIGEVRDIVNKRMNAT